LPGMEWRLRMPTERFGLLLLATCAACAAGIYVSRILGQLYGNYESRDIDSARIAGSILASLAVFELIRVVITQVLHR